MRMILEPNDDSLLYIPANPPAHVRREEAPTPDRDIDLVSNWKDLQTGYDKATGTLRINFGRRLVSWFEVRDALAMARQQGIVKTVVVLVSQQTLIDQWPEFQRQGFDRDESREKFIGGLLAMTKMLKNNEAA